MLSFMLEARIKLFEKYIDKMAASMHKSCLDYWKKYGDLSELQYDSTPADRPSQTSLYVFPGRKRCRSGIKFERHDRQLCTKNYFKGTSKIPSFLTVQCSCRHPKLLGFVILRECESISAALSSVLTHFRIPPRRIWYDNACNTFDCAVSRVPWMLRWTTFMVDRFHYTGHTCYNAFNGSMHPMLDDDRTVAAEVLNAVLEKGSSHIAYLKGANVIPFMRVLFANMNATSHVRDSLLKDDLEDHDILELYRSTFDCICHICDMHRRSGTSRSTDDHGFRNGVFLFSRNNEQLPLPSV